MSQNKKLQAQSVNLPPEPLDSEQRRAIEILAGAGPLGFTDTTLLAHGFSIELLIGLIRAGLATAQPEVLKTGARREIEVDRVKITDAGRKALES